VMRAHAATDSIVFNYLAVLLLRAGEYPPSVSCARVICQGCRRSSRFKLREHSKLLSAVGGKGVRSGETLAE
jgi:hypothetical protein